MLNNLRRPLAATPETNNAHMSSHDHACDRTGGGGVFWCFRRLTAEQQLLPSVWQQRLPDRGQATGHGSAQVTRVAEGPHRQAVQVHRLNQVGKERPLQANHAPPVRQTGQCSLRGFWRTVNLAGSTTFTHFASLSVQDMVTRGGPGARQV